MSLKGKDKRKKKKSKSELRAKDFGDMTPADFDRRKRLSIAADRKSRHKDQHWEGGKGSKKRTAKSYGDKTPKDYDAEKRRSINIDRAKKSSKEPWEVRHTKSVLTKMGEDLKKAIKKLEKRAK